MVWKQVAHKVFSNVPVLTLFLIMAYIVYGYVETHLSRLLQYGADERAVIHRWRHEGLVESMIFSVLLAVYGYCIVKTCVVNPGIVPEAWDYEKAEVRALVDRYQLIERKNNGALRCCKWCRKFKPDRTHHCSRCRQCVLRMDHHCPWLNTCVGHHNIKFFTLTIFYGSVLSVYMAVSSLSTFEYYTHALTGMISLRSLWLFSSMYFLVIATGTLLFFYTTFMVFSAARNKTTLEFCESHVFQDPQNKSIAWTQGPYANLKQILGPYFILWLMPIDLPSRGDGLRFPVTQENQGLKQEGSLYIG